MRVCPQCGRVGEERTCPADGLPMVEERLFAGGDEQRSFVGRVFDDRYEVEAQIGAGGMGWVFRARHRVMGHQVALKVMRRDMARDRAAVQRFYQEARACSALKHHHTIKVHDFGITDDGFPYLSMEYLEGRSLGEVLRDEGGLAPVRAVHIAAQVCKSLHEAHEVGLIHRDLKPANIFLTDMPGERDYVKVLDFGIAKTVGDEELARSLTMTGAVVGTPKYMSPEQIRGLPLDRRSDLYSLGIVLFEMLTGDGPFEATSTAEMLALQLREKPPALATALPAGAGVPPALCALVDALLSKTPDGRPASAVDVLERLTRISLTEVSAARPSGPRRARRKAQSGLTLAEGVDAIDIDDDPTMLGAAVPRSSSPSAPAARSSGGRRALPYVLGGAGFLVVVVAAFLVARGLAPSSATPAAEPTPVADRSPVANAPAALEVVAAPDVAVALDVAPAPDLAAAHAEALPDAAPAPERRDVRSTPRRGAEAPGERPPRGDGGARPPGGERRSPEAVTPHERPVRPTAAEKVEVVLRSRPSGASVLVGGAILGRTPMTLAGHAGERRAVLLRRAGYEDRRAVVELEAGGALDVVLERKRAATPPPPEGGSGGGSTPRPIIFD